MERRRVVSREQGDSDMTETFTSINSDQSESYHNEAPPMPWSDKSSILILLFLYVLQGIPMGLASSIPMILQNRNVSYKDQAIFSFVSWPFSIKLIWAPIIDSWFWPRLGRRKTWLIPMQYLLGISMLLLSSRVTSLLGSETSSPNVYMLTAVFFVMYFFAATQDIAVDGWALTMLSRENVSYASVCNTVGATAGYFLGNVVFLAFESADFCNKYLRSYPEPEGLVTLAGFMKFWGIIFMITTTIILIFKSEREELPPDELNIKETYSQLYRIMCLPNIRLLIGFLLTAKIAFGAADGITSLKLIEAGVPKEHLALMAIPMVPIQILLPLIVGKYVSGPRPLSIYLMAYPFRIMFGCLFAVLVWWTYRVKLESGEFPLYYYLIILFIYALHQITVNCTFVSQLSFFAKVSDPSIGGTYMTLLNTIANLGSNWPLTLALSLVDTLSSSKCGNPLLSCDTKELSEECINAGSQCITYFDGYYIEIVMCTIFGLIWLRWGKSVIRKIQHLPMTAWKCPR